MGLIRDDKSIIVRPFRNTQTCRNLLSSGYGVANLTDSVLAFVQCGLYDMLLPHFPAAVVPGVVFRGTCSWFEFSVVERDGTKARAEFHCRLLHQGKQKEYGGLCRASHAVIEAAILATRMHLADPNTAVEQLIHCREIVEKTGGDDEKQAFRLIQEYIQKGESDDRGQNLRTSPYGPAGCQW